MEIDWNVVRARFTAMTRDELLEEAALHADDYAPLAQRILEGEALARGITAAQIEARRGSESPAVEADGIDVPALITSSDDKGHVQEFVKSLRERGIPAVIRELDPKAFHASGHRVGRWGLMVSGRQAADAARVLESAFPPAAEAAEEAGAAGCGGGCCPGGECAPSGEEWPEDGDWWKTVPGEDDPHGHRP
jgi:hypothetical protein